jgi:hypothetical protein
MNNRRGSEDKATSRAVNARPWQPMPGMEKRQCMTSRRPFGYAPLLALGATCYTPAWQHYAAEAPTDFDQAKDKLQALASVMGAMIGDIIEKWDWMMVQGIIPEEKFENDFGPIIDPRMAETYARWAWERQSDAV